jgi:hypothetical protein
MGGEPLLHPRINEFMRIARHFFPKSDIAIHSNGILLAKMDDTFWETCSEYHIDIILSYYPIKLDYTYLCHIAGLHNVRLKCEIDTGRKMFRNFKMDLTGQQNYLRSWFYCIHANASVNLYEGKLFTCDITAHSRHLARFFNVSLKYTSKDYIDIYKEQSMESILNKLNKPHPFCRYCCPNDSKIIDWRRTNHELSEWAKV